MEGFCWGKLHFLQSSSNGYTNLSLLFRHKKHCQYLSVINSLSPPACRLYRVYGQEQNRNIRNISLLSFHSLWEIFREGVCCSKVSLGQKLLLTNCRRPPEVSPFKMLIKRCKLLQQLCCRVHNFPAWVRAVICTILTPQKRHHLPFPHPLQCAKYYPKTWSHIAYVFAANPECLLETKTKQWTPVG